MSVEQVEGAAAALGDVLADVAFLGGAALALWITDPGAPPVRPTKDVDVIVEVGSTVDYYALGERLRELRFEEDPERGILCAWRHLDSDIQLDVMPTDESVLGFPSDWYREALTEAARLELPSGTIIRAVSPPYLLATKIAAFRDRGKSDFLASVDFGDVVSLVDGRAEIVTEIRDSRAELRSHLSEEFRHMRSDGMFEGAVQGALTFLNQGRAPTVLARIDAVIAS